MGIGEEIGIGVCCYINTKLFNKYWEIMKKDKNDKTHTQQDRDIYYSIFKEIDEETFKRAVKLVLLKAKYFPRIDEMNDFIELAEKEISLEKISKGKQEEELTTEEEKELKKLLEDFK